MPRKVFHSPAENRFNLRLKPLGDNTDTSNHEYLPVSKSIGKLSPAEMNSALQTTIAPLRTVRRQVAHAGLFYCC